MSRATVNVFAATLLLSHACIIRVGPKTIRSDRFDYSAAISNSHKIQMMLNLVRVRYLDPPVFLDVAQVVATYTLSGEAHVGTPDWPSGVYYPEAGASERWAESPTITYNPMSGERFTRSLLAPVSPVAVFQLVLAGWPVDTVFSIAVRGINGLHAASGVEMARRQADPRFYELLRLLRELQLTDMFSIRVQAAKEGKFEESMVEFRRHAPDEAALLKSRQVKKMLGLNPEASQFRIVFGAVQTGDNEIALLTRSILEMIGEAAAGVEIPDSHVREGRAVSVPGVPSTGEQVPLFRVKVHSSSSKPGSNDAYIAARYHGHWFWIDDRDLTSKRGLGFLMLLSALAEAGTSLAPPVLTISKP